MKSIVDFFKTRVERSMFGVCDRLGQKMNIPSRRIRLFFIYASFLTVGSPVIIYLALAFLLDLKELMKQKRSSIWDL